MCLSWLIGQNSWAQSNLEYVVESAPFGQLNELKTLIKDEIDDVFVSVSVQTRNVIGRTKEQQALPGFGDTPTDKVSADFETNKLFSYKIVTLLVTTENFDVDSLKRKISEQIVGLDVSSEANDILEIVAVDQFGEEAISKLKGEKIIELTPQELSSYNQKLNIIKESRRNQEPALQSIESALEQVKQFPSRYKEPLVQQLLEAASVSPPESPDWGIPDQASIILALMLLLIVIGLFYVGNSVRRMTAFAEEQAQEKQELSERSEAPQTEEPMSDLSLTMDGPLSTTKQLEDQPFAFLQEFGLDELSLLLKDESPQVQAYIISQIEDSYQVAEVLKTLTPRDQARLIQELGNLNKLLLKEFKTIENQLKSKVDTISENKGLAFDGTSLAVELLNRVDLNSRKQIIDSLDASQAQRLKAQLEKGIFVFDALPFVPDFLLKKVIVGQQMIRNALMAIKRADPKVQEAIKACINEVNRRQVEETIERNPSDQAILMSRDRVINTLLRVAEREGVDLSDYYKAWEKQQLLENKA